MKSSRKARRPADETKAKLIRAFLRLAETRSASAISVRDVARLARVNHGLVHRLFGSKRGLVSAALGELLRVVHDQAGDGLGARSFETFRAEPGLATIVARACLDGPRQLVRQAAP